MWQDFEPTEIVCDDKIIDKHELVKNFLSDTYCKERALATPEDLSEFLKEIKEWKTGKDGVYGVYCIYNCKTKEVLDIGKSKNLHIRIREQLIGSQKKDEIRKFTRLFFAVLKTEKGIKEKEYFALPKGKREELAKFYQNTVFKPDNILRVCSTKDHMRAIVLEETLIRFFKNKDQCKYNYQL
jgi:hypothetical protein